jgi:general secretion pathway protein J
MNKKGFTLIEILLAVFIFSIIITIVFGSYNFVFSSAEHINEKINACNMASRCLTRMLADIESAYIFLPPQYSPPDSDDDPDPHRIEGSTGYAGNADFATLRFTSTEHLPMGTRMAQKGIAQIVYYVQKKEENNYSLYRSDNTSFSEPFEEKKSDPVLCEHVASLRFIYVDAEGDVHDKWDSESEDYGYLTPRAINIKLEILYNNTPLFFETTAYLPVFRDNIK